jgi:hypothetical protein
MTNFQAIILCIIASAMLIGIGEGVFYLLKKEIDNEIENPLN